MHICILAIALLLLPSVAQANERLVPCGDRAIIRQGPSSESKGVKVVWKGVGMYKIEEKDGWVKVMSLGVTGWVIKSEACMGTPPEQARKSSSASSDNKTTKEKMFQVEIDRLNTAQRLFEDMIIEGKVALVQVNVKWHYKSLGDQRLIAQGLQRKWAQIWNPNSPGTACIMIVDTGGNKVATSVAPNCSNIEIIDVR